MQKINFQDTEVVKAPYVSINGQEYPVQSQFEGGTDLNAETFNQLQDNVEEAIGEVQPEEWKSLPAGITFSYENFLQDPYNTVLLETNETAELTPYLRESFMAVKFKNDGVTKYGLITNMTHYSSEAQNHIWVYIGDNQTVINASITDFEYSLNRYPEDFPAELTYNYVQFLTENNNIYNNRSAVGFYGAEPIYGSFNIYTTDQNSAEAIVGKWIDGSPVFRKVVEIGSLGNNTTKAVQHGISNLKQVIKADFIWQDSGSYWWSNYRWDSASIYIKFNITSTDVRVESIGTDWSSRTSNCYAIIEYTINTNNRKIESLPLWPELPTSSNEGNER